MSFVGVVMLDTHFPRPVGDIGNPRTFEALGIPVRYQTVSGMAARAAVQDTSGLPWQPFAKAALDLVSQGATLITTSCGFLALHQTALQAAVPVPVLSSALLWLGQPALANEVVGVLTFDAASLLPAHWAGAGASPQTPVEGLPTGCHLQRCVLSDDPVLDRVAATHDVVNAAQRLVLAHPQLTTLVLECTNMPPYADAVAAATGRRVEHIMTLIEHHWSPTP